MSRPTEAQRLHDAKIIVQACNAHEDLLAALERCLPWITKAGEAGAFATCVRPNGWQKAIEQARAAIAKAKGGAA